MFINSRYVALLIILLVLLSVKGVVAQSDLVKSKQPNIVLITADDLGFDDLSMHGHPFIETPNLDAMAQQSVQFTDFTVTPVCSTTRAALLTGRDFYKTGVSGVHGGRDFLHLSETLISELLQENGYATGTWGKWHLGKTEGYYPWNRGFDQGYYAELYRHKNSFGWLNGKPVKHDKWVSEVVTDYAIDFIDDNKSKPFFAYLSYLAPHEPWLAPDKFVKPLVEQGLRPAVANLYGMINEMDFHIGRLLDHLKNQGLLDNTVVIFLSDNGPWWDSSNFGAMTKQEWQARNPSKMNGNKGQSWQNGIRSPLFVHWPSEWKPAKVSRYTDVKDLFPTLLELSRTENDRDQHSLDGYSLINYLNGDTSGENPRETYIGSHDVISNKKHFNQWTPIDSEARAQMRFEQQLIGLRTERFKLLLNPSMDQPSFPSPINRYVLIDMEADPNESKNVFAKYPKVARSMAQKLEARFSELKEDPNAYRPPVYQISADGVSVVNGLGPSKTYGNTLSKAHNLSNMSRKGDGAEYLVEAEKAGKYKVYIGQSSHSSVGIRVALSSTMNVIEYELGEAPMQHVGTLALPEGVSLLTLDVLANNSIKPWSAINGLRRLILIPADLNLSPDSIAVPN